MARTAISAECNTAACCSSVRNIGASACKITALPTLVLKNKVGKVLPITRKSLAGAPADPAAPPVGLASGAEATAAITWIAGPVFMKSTCFDVGHATILMPGCDFRQTVGSLCPQPSEQRRLTLNVGPYTPTLFHDSLVTGFVPRKRE